MKKPFIILASIVLLLVLFFVIFYFKDNSAVVKINNFQDCVDNGFPVMESYPRQCRTPDGRNFVEEIGNVNGKEDLIVVATPTQNTVVTSPLTVKGEARGFWFFEASFPVHVKNEKGEILGTGIAQAEGEWMTENFVPFTTTINFNSGAATNGVLVLEKDNPSGLPEHDDKLEIPVRFIPSVAQKECKPTGCSGQVCSDEDIITTCEFRPEYACYREAVCERQMTGECGWTETAIFKSCMANI